MWIAEQTLFGSLFGASIFGISAIYFLRKMSVLCIIFARRHDALCSATNIFSILWYVYLCNAYFMYSVHNHTMNPSGMNNGFGKSDLPCRPSSTSLFSSVTIVLHISAASLITTWLSCRFCQWPIHVNSNFCRRINSERDRYSFLEASSGVKNATRWTVLWINAARVVLVFSATAFSSHKFERKRFVNFKEMLLHIWAIVVYCVGASAFLASDLGPVVNLGYAAFAGNTTSPAGLVNGPVTFFGNIPYAQPPLGDLRFRAPQALNEQGTAKEVTDARNWGSPCIQNSAVVGVGSEGK